MTDVELAVSFDEESGNYLWLGTDRKVDEFLPWAYGYPNTVDPAELCVYLPVVPDSALENKECMERANNLFSVN